jgi:hypothetical protein
MGEFYLMTRKRLRRQVVEFVDVQGFDDPHPGLRSTKLLADRRLRSRQALAAGDDRVGQQLKS